MVRQVGEHGAWYLPGTRDQLPPYREIELSAQALRAAGFVVETSVDARPRSVADAEADRAARLDDRAQRLAERAERHSRAAGQREEAAARILGGVPLGQPILVGHCSEGRHRRDLDRADAHERAGREHDRRAADAAWAAEVAAGTCGTGRARRSSPGRLGRLQAERRRVQRVLDGHGSTGRRFAGSPEPRPVPPGEWRDRLLAQASLLDAQIRHWSGVHEAHRAAGRIDTVDWDQVRPGDLLQYRAGERSYGRSTRPRSRSWSTRAGTTRSSSGASPRTAPRRTLPVMAAKSRAPGPTAPGRRPVRPRRRA